MSEELCVVLDDRLAGRVTRDRGALRFAYDDRYRELDAPTPLSVSMPIDTAQYPDQVIRPWLAGLLPDNENVLIRWARTFHVNESPFSLLGTPIGEDCAGAVRFVVEDRLDAAPARTGEVNWLDDTAVAGRLRDLRRDETAWLGADFSGRFSLAGVQAKTALLYQDGRWGVPSGAAATSHILKPAISGLDDHDLNEHLCLRAARRADLLVANSEIASFEDQTAIVVERYDRVDVGGDWLRRIQQEDLCQALGLPPTRKYQNEDGPSSTMIVRLLRRLLPGSESNAAVLRFLDALIFNWLICGTDAHAKNYSLLLVGRQVRLAPLYDIASALPYPNIALQKMRLAMKFGGSYLVMSRTSDMWQRVSKELSLPPDLVIERARRLMDRLPDAFADAAHEPSMVALSSPMPAALVDAVARRVTSSKATLFDSSHGARAPVAAANGLHLPTELARVADLQAGQVISMPESGLDPALIDEISQPVGGSRLLRLTDLDSGEPLKATYSLGLHRQVRVHEIPVEHHTYTNIGSGSSEIRLGGRLLKVGAGDSVGYAGRARPDVFVGSDWTHESTPIAIDREIRPL